MEDLAYRRLMDVYYRDERAPRGTVEEVARLVKLRNNVQEVGVVLAEFFHLEGDSWVNDTCEENLARMLKAAEVARENGASGGRPKGSKDKQPRKPRGTRLPDDKTQREPNRNPAATQSEPAGNPAATQRQPSKKLPITHNPIHSAPIGAGDAAHAGAVDNFVNPPLSFPPAEAPAAPPAPAEPPPAPLPPPPAPKPPAGPPARPDGLFSAANGPFKPRPMSDFADMTSEIWGVGKDWLAWCGVNHTTAGRLIGKWLRDARSEQIVRDAIFDGIQEGTRDPQAYVAKIISESNKGRGRRQYPGDLRGMNYGAPPDFINGFPEADLN